MVVKTLKHKKIHNLYATIIDQEIFTSDIPQWILPATAKKDDLISTIRKINGSLAARVSSDYDLVDIEITEITNSGKQKISEQY